jgi:hypothetical protein
VKQRSEIFFSNPIYINSQFEAMGYAFAHVLDFSNEVKELCKPVIDNFLSQDCSYTENAIVVAMHLRHFDPKSRIDSSLDIEYDKKFQNALITLVTSVRIDESQHCHVLLASDRVESINRMSEYARSIGCTAYFAPRPMEDSPLKKCDEGDDLCMEQGPFSTGITQIADIYLLGHAHYFIGSHESTYSRMIATIVSWNHHRHSKSHFSSYMSPIQFENKMSSMFSDRDNYKRFHCKKQDMLDLYNSNKLSLI